MKQVKLATEQQAFNKNSGTIILNKVRFLEKLTELLDSADMKTLRWRVLSLRDALSSTRRDEQGLLNIDRNGDTISLKRQAILEELGQIEEAYTTQRAKYYVERLKKGIEETKTNKVNDLNLHRWKELDEVITDSLWVLDKRDTSGAHLGWYWGNFIPQIPHQIMLRYTKQGEWVLDPFVGSGTTLIECQRLERNRNGKL